MFSIDTSELRALAADMRQVDSRLVRWVRPVVEKGAVNIKNDLRAKMEESVHFAPVARGIDYEMKDRGFGDVGEYAAEIGPKRGKPGSLANIAYFGGANGGGTVEDPQAAADRELPNFEKALADLAADMVFGK